MSPPTFSFGPFSLEPASGRLLRDGIAVPIGHRGLTVLQNLAEAAGKTVSKSSLMERVWPGQIVEEGNLTVQIAALRKVMGTDGEGRDWILTVPREGYRLLGQNAPTRMQAENIILPSLAVLPFANLSGDLEQDYFADGVVEDIITALSRFKSFAVIARNSSFSYKGKAVDVRQVASELGVRYVLEGSVRRSANRLRISTRLVDAKSGAELWSQHFDGALDDVFDFQDRITEQVAGIVGPKIKHAEIDWSSRERPGSLRAYDLYLQAMARLETLRPEANAAGLLLLEQAIALDPGFNRAIAMAAWGYEYRLHMGMAPLGPDDAATCLGLARQALAFAGDDALVIAHCGIILQLTAHEWDQGLATVERAIALNPLDPTVQFFGGVGNLKGGSLSQAAVHFHRAIDLSPNQAAGNLAGLGYSEFFSGRFSEALDWGRRALAMDTNFGWIHWLNVAANAHLGELQAARRALSLFRETFPDVRLARIESGQQTRDPARVQILTQGLRLAGMPE